MDEQKPTPGAIRVNEYTMAFPQERIMSGVRYRRWLDGAEISLGCAERHDWWVPVAEWPHEEQQ